MINVKKILLIGKFNTVFQDKSIFDDLYNVQICVDNPQMVKGMLKIKQPELVAISFIGISAGAEQILEELKMNYSEVPVICIGTEEDMNTYADNIEISQFTRLISPDDNAKLLDIINSILDFKVGDDMPSINVGGKKSILLVDDSNIQLRALNELLKEKYEVRMATSGMQALTMIGKKLPDIIFLDYEMPICDGRMTLEMIRGLDEAKDIPVVFLTGVSDKEHIAAVLNLKPVGYLLKPAQASSIYDIIEKVLG